MTTEWATTIECPCCGAVGAVDPDGFFQDGQPLVCGCKGHVSCDSETEPYVWADDCDCAAESTTTEEP